MSRRLPKDTGTLCLLSTNIPMTPHRLTTGMRSSEKSSRRIRLLVLLVVACCLPSRSQGFGKSSSSRITRLSKRLWNEFSDLYTDRPYDTDNSTDPTTSGITAIVVNVNETTEEEPYPSESRGGLVRGLWRRGVNTSVGVRTIDIDIVICRRTDLLLVRGGSSTKMNHPLSHVDRWARSLALSLAWVVSFQTFGAAMVAYRDSLYEVCVDLCVSAPLE